jgi:hypothetical protein
MRTMRLNMHVVGEDGTKRAKSTCVTAKPALFDQRLFGQPR